VLQLDGSQGEGGGQVLRSALALSMVTGEPFRIDHIRAKRDKPGVMRQHLTAVQAAQAVCGGTVAGASVGSSQLTFEPGKVIAGEHHFAVGTAGSTTLVLQTILPALLIADAPSRLVLEGGTHNPLAPPFDFLQRAFLPLVNRMGPHVSATLDRPGFYPAGGGQMTIEIKPAKKLTGLELLERGETVHQQARAMVARLPVHIAERELAVIEKKLGWSGDTLVSEEVPDSPGPGNIVLLIVETEHVTEVFTGFGKRGVRAEAVADEAAQQYRQYLKANVPIGQHLADQLILPLAIAGEGRFRTLPLNDHATTQIGLVQQFLDVAVNVQRETRDQTIVSVGAAQPSH
jgi:RNA 3'-terminal phosphate cyclase (ATP)